MKALSIRQPWANMIASGKKTIETRTWRTNYRGPLLIVSSRTPRIEPAGYALAVAELIDCRPMTREDEEKACYQIYPRAQAWVLTNIRRIDPFPVNGKLGLNSPVIPEKCDHFADVISLLFVFILRQHPGEKEKMLCPFYVPSNSVD